MRTENIYKIRTEYFLKIRSENFLKTRTENIYPLNENRIYQNVSYNTYAALFIVLYQIDYQVQ